MTENSDQTESEQRGWFGCIREELQLFSFYTRTHDLNVISMSPQFQAKYVAL